MNLFFAGEYRDRDARPREVAAVTRVETAAREETPRDAGAAGLK